MGIFEELQKKRDIMTVISILAIIIYCLVSSDYKGKSVSSIREKFLKGLPMGEKRFYVHTIKK